MRNWLIGINKLDYQNHLHQRNMMNDVLMNEPFCIWSFIACYDSTVLIKEVIISSAGLVITVIKFSAFVIWWCSKDLST